MSTFEKTLKKYLDIFTNQEMYFVNDLKNLELFQKIPSNNNADDIRTKISSINDPDVSRHALLEDVITHILNLKTDDKIKKGDLSLVESLASFQAQGQSFHLLHFASVYCNFHRPDVFPIYSDQYHNFYKRYIQEHNLPLDPEKITTYDIFSKALNDLIVRLNLKGKLDYLHMRKFAWLYADSILSESVSNEERK